MLNLASVLNYIKNGIEEKIERYEIIDEEHVLDTVSGIKLHVYDDWFKMTHNGVVIATMRDFDRATEQPIIWEIKLLITPEGVAKERKDNYLKDIMERREQLSLRFEHPEPVSTGEIPIEQSTEEYNG